MSDVWHSLGHIQHRISYTCCTRINLLGRWCSWYYLHCLDRERKWMKYQLDQPSKQEFLLACPHFYLAHRKRVTQGEWSSLFFFSLDFVCATARFHPLFMVLLFVLENISPLENSLLRWSPWDVRNGTGGKATTPSGARDLIEWKPNATVFGWATRETRTVSNKMVHYYF